MDTRKQCRLSLSILTVKGREGETTSADRSTVAEIQPHIDGQFDMHFEAYDELGSPPLSLIGADFEADSNLRTARSSAHSVY